MEAVGAGLLVGEGSAHPRLSVGHPPRHLRPHQRLHAAQLVRGPVHLVGGIAELLDAVAQRGFGATEGGAGSAEGGDVGAEGADAGEGDVGCDAGELGEATPDGGGVGGEGSEAEVGVVGEVAARADELGVGVAAVEGGAVGHRSSRWRSAVGEWEEKKGEKEGCGGSHRNARRGGTAGGEARRGRDLKSSASH